MKFNRSPKQEVPRRRNSSPDDEPSLASQSSQFRRNQTLSSFRRASTPEVSHRHQLHQLADRRRKIGGVFVLVLTAVILLTILLTQFVAQVAITSSSTQIARPINTETYQRAIEDYYATHPVERLRFALNQTALQAAVSGEHPEVQAIALNSVTDIVGAQFSITFRRPIAGWQINNQQYYVDKEGVVFRENYYATPSLQIVDDSGISPAQGSAVASARLLSFVGRAAHAAGERGYSITSVTLPAGTTRQLELRLENVSPVIRVSIDRGAGEQIEDMDVAWKYLQSKQQSAGYIDVRTEGKAVYR